MVTLLPVVRREMRVAARRRTTFLVRFVGAVSAVLLGGAFLLPAAIPGVAGASGRLLLQILGTLALILTLVAGPLLTADCISRERREGTLGFLFLTDLNGLDVVAGKFAALSLVPIHGLLAALPVAALTLCLGGVTATEFWAVQLVLFNTLFLSLAIGIWVSSLVSDDRQALGTALALVAAVTLVPGVAGATIQALLPHSEWTLVRIAGPAGILEGAFDQGTRTGPSYFLFGFLFQHGLAWCFLATSALIVRHSWRDQGVTPAPAETPGESWNQARDEHQWRDGPLAWYAWRNSWARRGTWWLAGGALAVALLAYLILEFAGQRTLAQGTAAGLLTAGFYLLKLLLAVHVVYFLQDACRTGAMELLLATPISSQALCAGHLAALRRLFTRPFLVLAVASISLAVLGRLLDGGDWPSIGIRFLTAGVPALFSVVLHGLDLVAVAYHASRWALFYDRPAKALLRTTVLLLLLPALFCSVGRLFVDLFVILQSRPLLERFRDLVRGWYFPGFLGTGYGAPRTG